jgi:hypothetical protein
MRGPGRIVGGDGFKIINCGDDFRGDAVAFRRHAQQHFHEFDGGGAIGRRFDAFDARQRFGIAHEPAFDRIDNAFAQFRSLETFGQRA